MPLRPGARLGPYEIIAAAGAGGMGEVYRARDTRLDRTVAIKVLPPDLAVDLQLRERFEREARAISSLQHPHICALFDIGEAPLPHASDSSPGAAAPEARTETLKFLVLEYLEGETLADRLARTGALPLGDALKIAIEICDALDKAHRSGIIHRDLKPANVMLTKGGAKLLDFGLAKATAPVVATSGLSMLPTTPPSVTAQGTILGTFQYMAPEQIEGLDADARTDIFAFGGLVFEMATGRTAFAGKTRATLLGSILKDDPPPVSSLRADAPVGLDRVIAVCLAKDPDDRYQSARDLLRDLRWVATGHPAPAPVTHTSSRSRRATRWASAIVGGLGIAAIAAVLVATRPWQRSTAVEQIQFTIAPPGNSTFATPIGGGTGVAPQVAVSPDGKFVVFVGSDAARSQLWLRPIGSLETRALPGTDGGAFPFWSPDSRYVAFFAHGKLLKVPIAGSPPLVLCDATGGRGGTWNQDNVIVFTPTTNGALQRVSAAGGIPTEASVLDTDYGETNHRFPHFLPDGRHFLFTASVATCCPAVKPARIKIGTLDSADTVVLMQAESAVAYASSHLVFNRDGVLMAQAFDAAGQRLTGDPFPIAERVASEGSRYASASVSHTGVLVYAEGVQRPTVQLSWLDRTGQVLSTLGGPAGYFGLALSPDERRLAVIASTGTPENRDIWLLDMERGTPTRVTFDPGDDNAPIWSPDGSRIVFQASRDGAARMRQKRVDSATVDEPLAADIPAGAQTPGSWSPDGRHIVFWRMQGVGGSADIWVLPLEADRKAMPLVQTPAAETNAVFSPDGRWFAYQSNESGQTQVYVQPFPPTGGKFQISQNGGVHAEWRRDGKELFFLAPDARMMSVAVDTTGQFTSSIPTPLFTVNTTAAMGGASAWRQYAVSRDGKRFLIAVLQQQMSTNPLTVVVNWPAVVQK